METYGGKMSKCELCGGDVLRFSDGYKGCLNPTCAMGSATYVEQSFDRIQTALALLRRVEEGESVEIRKRDGEWPFLFTRKQVDTIQSYARDVWADGFDSESRDDEAFCDGLAQINAVTDVDFIENAAAWNGGGK